MRLKSRPFFRPISVVFFAALCSGGSLWAQTPAPNAPNTPNTGNPAPPQTAPAAQGIPLNKPFPPSDLRLPLQSTAPQATPGNVETPNLSGPLTLNDAIGLALQIQPNIAVANANREGGEQRARQNITRYYPFITPTYTYSTGYNYTQTSRFVADTTGTGTVPIGNADTGTTGSTVTGTTGTGSTTTTRQTGTGTGTGTGSGTTGNGGTGTNTNTGTTGGTVVTGFQGNTFETRTANIGASFRVYDSGVRELNARQGRQNVRALTFAEENTRQTTIVNVADTYFAALRTAALVRVSEAQVARAANTRAVIRAQVEVGVTAAKDQLQADADFFNAQVNLLTAQNNAANSLASLKNAIGLVGGAPLTLTDVAPPTETTQTTVILDADASQPAGSPAASQATPSQVAPPVSSVPTNLPVNESATIDRLADLAYRTRPDIAQSLQSIESNQTGVSLARVNNRVIVTSDISGGYGLDGRDFSRSTGNNRNINVNVSYPLFDAGLSRSQVRAAEANVRSSSAQLTSLRQQIAVQVEQFYRTLTVARATLPAALAAQQAAQVNYDAALASKQEGVGSIVDVITAQTALVQAQINYVQAVYNFYTADADLARAVGQASRIGQAGASPANAAPPANAPNTPPPANAPAAPATPVAPPAGGEAKPTSVPGGPTGPKLPTAPVPPATPTPAPATPSGTNAPKTVK